MISNAQLNGHREHHAGAEHQKQPPHVLPVEHELAFIDFGFAELDSSGDEGGDTTYTYRGGIYMASSVADSTRVWNVKVDKPQEVVGTLGWPRAGGGGRTS